MKALFLLTPRLRLKRQGSTSWRTRGSIALRPELYHFAWERATATDLPGAQHYLAAKLGVRGY